MLRSCVVACLLVQMLLLPCCGRPSVAIDTAFVHELDAIPREEFERRVTEQAGLIWDKEEEFRYLLRKQDPAAVRVAVRLIGLGYIPGGCECTNDVFDADLCPHGACEAFWAELAALPIEHQVRVLRVVDAHPYDEACADSWWQDDRTRFLESRLDLAAAYGESTD